MDLLNPACTGPRLHRLCCNLAFPSTCVHRAVMRLSEADSGMRPLSFFPEDLQAHAGMFKKGATQLKKQMWWKNFRVRGPRGSELDLFESLHVCIRRRLC
jgi:hypothetical protein